MKCKKNDINIFVVKDQNHGVLRLYLEWYLFVNVWQPDRFGHNTLKCISDVFGNIKYVLVLDIHFLKEVEEIFLKYNEKIWRDKEFTPVWGYIRKLSLILTDEI
jgi:hypothetical protein